MTYTAMIFDIKGNQTGRARDFYRASLEDVIMRVKTWSVRPGNSVVIFEDTKPVHTINF